MGVILLTEGLPQWGVKQVQSDGCHSPVCRPEVKQSSSRVMGVILLTEGSPQEPDFEDQDDLQRGQRSGKARGE
jgi:hypothetical protein